MWYYSNGMVNIWETSLKEGYDMKVKLKEGAAPLESHSSHQGFNKKNWIALNAGETVEVESIPNAAKGQVEEVSSSPAKTTKKTSSTGGKK
jgi:hypothetical protein